MGFRFVDHTADVCVECRAPDFAGLLETAVRALYAVALEGIRDAGDEERALQVKALEVTGADREQTLVRWLQEVLFLLDVERFVAVNFEFVSVAPVEVRATLKGYIHGPEERATEVKAATYHEMKIEEREGHLIGTVVFDL